jgi:hypothetical protein
LYQKVIAFGGRLFNLYIEKNIDNNNGIRVLEKLYSSGMTEISEYLVSETALTPKEQKQWNKTTVNSLENKMNKKNNKDEQKG